MPLDRRAPPHFPPLEMANRATIVFLTVCTNKRIAVLADETAHAALREAWRKAADWKVGRYVILPDHIHAFCAPAPQCSELIRWVAYWKRLVSTALGYGRSQRLWQQHFWDTQLRQGESYAAKWDYVRNNPVRHGLASKPEEWPFQGEMIRLDWCD